MAEQKGQGGESVVRRVEDALRRIHDALERSRAASPLMVKLTLADIGQLCVGACLLAIPISYTEEVWALGRELPGRNVLGIAFFSVAFLAGFGYLIFYRSNLRGNEWEYVKRIVAAYVITLLVCTIILTLIEKCPWATDPATAVKRVVLVAFPACFSATVVDALK